MSQKTTLAQLSNVQQPSGTTPLPVVSVQQTLSPEDIERICKAFIRLITAKETRSNGK